MILNQNNKKGKVEHGCKWRGSICSTSSHVFSVRMHIFSFFFYIYEMRHVNANTIDNRVNIGNLHFTMYLWLSIRTYRQYVASNTKRLRYSNEVNWLALILSKELLLLIASQFPDLLFCITMHRINYIIIM